MLTRQAVVAFDTLSMAQQRRSQACTAPRMHPPTVLVHQTCSSLGSRSRRCHRCWDLVEAARDADISSRPAPGPSSRTITSGRPLWKGTTSQHSRLIPILDPESRLRRTPEVGPGPSACHRARQCNVFPKSHRQSPQSRPSDAVARQRHGGANPSVPVSCRPSTTTMILVVRYISPPTSAAEPFGLLPSDHERLERFGCKRSFSIVPVRVADT
ncbi:hypothetical protein B0T18DRAFT_420658 [Schizothecium vesticola]|uniref:Uncharacterized protein n=1 Tax=Schizothecium vesticola TaxID=314040 RepID=A0AA40EIF2_9PEZI|nr:hypothetical protein B0T18DRAFT_420658 [Schizothecium vesticola]